MWRNHENLAVICSAYQYTIKVITIDGINDNNPKVNIVEPVPALANMSDIPSGWIPEVTLLDENNSHYNLIIPKSSKLAQEGGLDYQRMNKKNVLNITLKKKKNRISLRLKKKKKKRTLKMIFIEVLQ